MSDSKLMKDGLGKEAVQRIATALAATVPDFPEQAFQAEALQGLSTLELRQRVSHIIQTMHKHLPADFRQTAKCLNDLPACWDSGRAADSLASFAAWPLIDYVGDYGLDHPECALKLLKRLTPMFSAEFAVRPFLVQHPELSLQHFRRWCKDPDPHVRRLASEGCRPRLPWGRRLTQFVLDPSPVLALLENLKDDSSDYVRRSVANNLNDIAKDHPDRVIERCQDWSKDSRPERDWIIRHATRTLVKQGYPGVFALLGYTDKPRAEIREFKLAPSRIKMGESVTFSFALQSTHTEPQSFVVDYAIHFMKANGKRAAKVFKLRTPALAPGESLTVSKSHSFRLITTRRYYAGEHRVALMINGQEIQSRPFELCAG